MNRFLSSVFEKLEIENIQYCLIRDGDRIDQMAHGGEIDLLIQSNQLDRLANLLIGLGFIHVPDFGHYPHHFFISHDGESDSWYKFDIVTEITYGRPIPVYRTTLASECLNTRRRDGLVYVPSPEVEFITLLLHCLLDKGYFSQERKNRLRRLVRQSLDLAGITRLLNANGSPFAYQNIANFIVMDDWDSLLKGGKNFTKNLSRLDRLSILVYQVRTRIVRVLVKLVYAQRPQSLSMALLAPDGAGKTSLAAELKNTFYFPAHIIYMGLYKKETNKVLLLRVPGINFLIRILRQWGKYLLSIYFYFRRELVIFDRYTYDALLSPHPPGLLGKLRRWILSHSCPRPDLIIVLDAPGEILYSRKGEHNPTYLEQQRQAYLGINSKVPGVIVVDATPSMDAVRRQVTSLIWCGYLNRQAGLDFDKSILASEENSPEYIEIENPVA
jgi:hypothetical protein